MKTKGQQPQVAKLELLACVSFRGAVAEWLNATGCKPADGAQNIVRGFKSLPRRQNCNYTPAEALTSTGARIAQPKPYESNNFSIRLLAVELNRRFHSDLPQLPNRNGEGR